MSLPYVKMEITQSSINTFLTYVTVTIRLKIVYRIRQVTAYQPIFKRVKEVQTNNIKLEVEKESITARRTTYTLLSKYSELDDPKIFSP